MAKSTLPTLKELAAETELAVSSVSKILRGHGNYPDSTRQRVLDTAKRLNYRPNMLVRSIRTGKSRMVGVVVPPVDDFDGCIVQGIQDVLASAHYAQLNQWHLTDSMDFPSVSKPTKSEIVPTYSSSRYSRSGASFGMLHLDLILDRRVDGLILFPEEPSVNQDCIEEIRRLNLPLVLLDRLPPGINLDGVGYVGSDELPGMIALVEHLLRLGHKHIAYVSAEQHHTTVIGRHNAFMSAMARQGLSCETVSIAGDLDEDLPKLAQYLRSHPKITALVAFNDYFAMIAYQAAYELGLHIPRDLSVTGFADLMLSRYAAPPLTTVRQNPYKIGFAAAEMLVARLEGQTSEMAARLIPVELIERASTAPPRSVRDGA